MSRISGARESSTPAFLMIATTEAEFLAIRARS